MSLDAAFVLLREAAETPAREWTARYPGRRPMATFCSYVSEEIIHAAGYTPVRIRKKPSVSGASGAHLQSYTCPLVRSLIEQGIEGDLADFAGAVFAHSCDAMQALADIWKIRFPDHFVWVVNQPTRLDSAAAGAYLSEELRRFVAALEAHGGAIISDEALHASISLYQEIRRLVAELHRLRPRMTATEFYAAALAAQTMPPNECAGLFRNALADASRRPLRPVDIRLLVAGPILDDLTLPSLADDLGIALVGDDLCTSMRHFEAASPPLPDTHPIAHLVRRSLTRTPCAAKHREDFRRGQMLLDLAKTSGAQGVIFYLQKFCEPHAFDYGLWRRFLEERGLPVLLLEDDASTPVAQWRTRLQAFAEMLE